MSELTKFNLKTSHILLTTFALSLFVILVVLVTQDDSLANLRQSNAIRVGYAIEAPFAYLDENGNVTGESPEVAKAIIQLLDIDHIEWVQTDFEDLIPGLLENRYDVVAAGLFITPERAQFVRFSNPTFHVQPGLLVQAGNPLQLGAYQDIATNSAVSVAVLSGSVEERVLQEMATAESQMIIVPDARTGQTAVASKLVDALALSSVTVRWMAAKDTTGQITAAEMAPIPALTSTTNWGYGGFAFHPDHQRLANAWNEAQANFIGSPEHLDLITQFGFTAAELPGKQTTATIVQP